MRTEYEAAVIDLNFEGQDQDGIDLLQFMNRESPGTFLIVLSGDQSTKRIFQAHRQKHFAAIYKDTDFYEPLLSALNRALQLKRAREQGRVEKYLTNSTKVKDVLEAADRILRSKSGATILIQGETGSGKEFLAQHIASNMKKRIVAENMANIPRETAESILFGHERGAFTGAIANKIGLIEAANGGVFFLDEIGECSLEIQSKLLRVIQEKEVQPLGASRPRKVDVQFIAASHRDIEQMTRDGSFRLDLFQRLSTFVLHLPALRERPEDILLYANLFLDELAEEGERYSLTPDGIHAITSYNWPGNTRELKSVIERIVVLSNKRDIDAETVGSAIGMGKGSGRPSLNRVALGKRDLKREELTRALNETHGNRRKAADLLGVCEATVYRWIQDCGLTEYRGTSASHGQGPTL